MSTGIKPELLKRLACPHCGKALITDSEEWLACRSCGRKVPIEKGKPIFTPAPPGMQAAPKLIRGPGEGSPWRCANWRFLEKCVNSLPREAVILDFGAGHGDFSEILNRRTFIALDVYPYNEVDIVCNLEEQVPFRKKTFDVIVLMNVLEHIRQPEKLMQTLRSLLKPSGLLIVTIPFLLKLHQQPYDFYRYSHHQIKEMGQRAGFDLAKIEGYYDPILLYQESTHNIKTHVLPGLSSIRRKVGRVLLSVISGLLAVLQNVIGGGYVRDPVNEKSPYPIGYHVVYRARAQK
jgi:SAM-dependent methyltransferase